MQQPGWQIGVPDEREGQEVDWGRFGGVEATTLRAGMVCAGEMFLDWI